MCKSIIYRPHQRRQIWLAFTGSILIHLGAVAASHRSSEIPPIATDGETITVTFEQAASVPDEPPKVEAPLEPVQPPLVQSEFTEGIARTPNYRFVRVKPRPAKRATVSTAVPAQMTAVKVAAIYAPRPDYPYEARRQHATGSGLAILNVDRDTGYVRSVEMRQSTGNKLLDDATITAFQRWRFKPGAVLTVQTPITFTLFGVQY